MDIYITRVENGDENLDCFNVPGDNKSGRMVGNLSKRFEYCQ